MAISDSFDLVGYGHGYILERNKDIQNINTPNAHPPAFPVHRFRPCHLTNCHAMHIQHKLPLPTSLKS